MNNSKKMLHECRQVLPSHNLELSSPKKIFKTLDKKYSATNFARLCQLLYDC